MTQVRHVLSIARRLSGPGVRRRTLAALATAAGLSPGHLQREFSRIAGMSPLRYQRRVRVLRVIGELLSGDRSIRRLALEHGFGGAEGLIRSFRAEFGCTPQQFRRRARGASGGAGSRPARFAAGLDHAGRVAPCVPFFHVPQSGPRRPVMPMLSVALSTLETQPALVLRSRIPRSAIAATIGASLGRIVPYALGAGGTLTGQPFARYPDFGPGMITIEVGMPLASPVPGHEDIEAFALPAGLTAVAVHGGAYEQMPETYAALEKWIASQGRTPNGAPWEVYVSDPAEHPDPADWRTEIRWPVR